MPTPQSTGYTNLAKYVNANQDNQLGNTVQSGVQKGISGLQSNVNQANQQFQGDVNQSNLNTPQNQQYVQNTIGNISNPLSPAPANSAAPQGQVAPTTQSTSPLASLAPPQTMPAPTPATAGPSALDTTPAAGSTPASATPTASATATSSSNAAPGSFGATTPAPAVSNPSYTGGTATPNTYTPAASDVSKFGQLMQGSYTGPTQLNNYNALLAQGQNLQGLGQNLNTQGGLQSLLQQYIGGPGYNQGEQGLDTILLGQTGKPQLQNIAKSLQNVINIPQGAESQAEGLAQQTATGNQQLGQSIQNQIASAQNPILQNIQNSITAANTQNQGTIANEQAIYNLLNNANAVAGPNGNRIGGGYAAPTTDLAAAQQAALQANQTGLVDPQTYAYLQKAIPMMQAAGQDPKTLLASAFGQVQQAPTYALQQGANAQQAAQLNALQQLAGQAPQYTNYGGLTPLTGNDFDNAPLPTIASLTPTPPPQFSRPLMLGAASSGGG